MILQPVGAKMNLKLLVTAAIAALAMSAQAHAATDYNFRFSNDPSQGDINGTVLGRIYGLGDNYVGAASSVVIFNAGGVPNLPGAPFSVEDYASDLGLFISQNFFVVNNSHIDFAVYQIFGGYFDMNVNAGPNYNSMVSPDAAHRIQNLQGLNGLTFTAAPEPATWALMLGGFGLAGASLRVRRRALAAA